MLIIMKSGWFMAGEQGVRRRAQTALTVLVVAVAASSLFAGHALAAGKIGTSVGSVTLTEGSSQNISLQLDAPIICPMGASTCNVSLAFNSTDPSVSVSPTPLVWDYTQWVQVKQLTINTTDDHVYTGDKNVTLTATAVSNSVYYSGFQISIPVTVDEADLPPAPGITDKHVTIAAGSKTVVDVLTGVSGSPDPSTLTITSRPKHGTAVDPPGTITYTPAVGYSGPDSLTYQVCSSINTTVCSSATLNFTVDPVKTAAIVKAAPPDTGYGAGPQIPYQLLAIAASNITLLFIGHWRLAKSQSSDHFTSRTGSR